MHCPSTDPRCVLNCPGDDSGDHVLLTVVIPSYRAAEILPELCRRLHAALSQITNAYEIILVDDGSPDTSWEVLQCLVNEYPMLIAIQLSRNFGQHYAITAGLDLSRGEWTVVMDCDLQDQPEEISRLYEKAQEGYDVVLARRAHRKDHVFRRIGSFAFWKVFRALSGYKVDHTVGSFRIMRRTVVDAYCGIKESYRSFGGLVNWLGFSTTFIDVTHHSRYKGRSSYTLKSLVKVFLDGIISFSNRPLYLAIVTGTVISLLTGCYGILQLVRYFLYGAPGVPGWLSTVTVSSFIGGLLLLNQGIIGLYIARIYDHTKGRPIYIIDQVRMGKAHTRLWTRRPAVMPMPLGVDNER